MQVRVASEVGSINRCEAVTFQPGMLVNQERAAGRGVDLFQVVVDWPRPLDPTAVRNAGRHGPDRHALVVALHHAVVDGHAVRTLLYEVCAGHDALPARCPSAPPPRPPLRDYATWTATETAGTSDATTPAHRDDNPKERPCRCR